MLGIGIFWKSQKLIPSRKNQSVVVAKISSRKTQKIAKPQKKSGKFVPHISHSRIFFPCYAE